MAHLDFYSRPESRGACSGADVTVAVDGGEKMNGHGLNTARCGRAVSNRKKNLAGARSYSSSISSITEMISGFIGLSHTMTRYE